MIFTQLIINFTYSENFELARQIIWISPRFFSPPLSHAWAVRNEVRITFVFSALVKRVRISALVSFFQITIYLFFKNTSKIDVINVVI